MVDQRGVFDAEVVRDGEEVILHINAENSIIPPSIEDSPIIMGKTVEKLIEVKHATKIVFSQKRDYEYDYPQTQLLLEMARLYNNLLKQKEVYGFTALSQEGKCDRFAQRWFVDLQNIVFRLLKADPLGAYVELKRMLRTAAIDRDKADPQYAGCYTTYLGLLDYLRKLLEQTKLVQLAMPQLAGYEVGNRDLYREIFHPIIKPDFMFAKLQAAYPPEGEEIDNYTTGTDTEVSIFKFPDEVTYLYHILPPEFKLSEDKYDVLDLARRIMAEHKPTREEFVNPKRMREVFENVGRDLIEELANYRGLKFTSADYDELVKILVRYTVGFGLIEVLLQDEAIQDISVNSPAGRLPMFIVHGDYFECSTNIIPTRSETESWATKLRLISGRPLDEANPILDTELELPHANARIAVISPPLNPSGLGFSFRRHRDRPWTLPLFLKGKMLNPLASGLLSFLVDGTRTLLIAGTRSSGKTSLLSSLIVDIMRRYRIITVEDTLELPISPLRELGFNIQSMKVASTLTKGSSEVSADEGIRSTLRLGDSALIIGEVRSSLRGREEVVIIENGLTKRLPIKNLARKNVKSFSVPTLSMEQKIELHKLTAFVRHPKRHQLLKLTTKTGRQVTVTPDHSVFTHVNFKIVAINTDQLRSGDPIIIPAKLPNAYHDINYLNLLEVFIENYRLEGAEAYIRKAINVLGWKRASKLCRLPDIYLYLRTTQKTRIPIKLFLLLMKKAKISYTLEDLRIKRGTANSIPAKFPINENILRFIGYYLAEGNIDATKIQITNSKQKIIEDIAYICKKEFGLTISKRQITGLGKSVQMYVISKPLSDLLVHIGCGKTSKHKRIPAFVYGLNEKKICALLRGMYSGDGSISSTKRGGNMIRYFSTSKKLVEDVGYLLLSLGIVCRFHERKPKEKNRRICYTAEIKQRKYIQLFLENIGFTHKEPLIVKRAFPHSTDDSVSFDPGELEKHLQLPRKYRHLRKTRCCSKDYLKRITEEVKCSYELYDFAHGDFFIDRVKSIEAINLKKGEHVYDLSVRSTERFVGGFGGILLHNTEAKALFESMRIGAAANVVAGTIHGDSPYGVFDRVVNDIGVPKTSFKATDIIVVANPIRSADGIHRKRRITQITEVRKHWENDPLLEGGFVDLMKYDAKQDTLIPTPDLINGESEVLKAIAANVKDFAGNWDALWQNIELRAKMREAQVQWAEKLKDPQLLEAPFTLLCNDMFHLCSDKVLAELGHMDPKRICFLWEDWLKRVLKKRSMA